ncbi:MAG TPA: hypothetical protein ENK15_04915 [Thermopetrobacter sp.]|nr:hypothetical protein [Thermopetrobacter sp.]
MSALGHNRRDAVIRVEVRMFNAICGPGQPRIVALELQPGDTIADIVKRLDIPLDKVFLILRNGRDVTPSLKGPPNVDEFLEDGDVIAFSGPVPYSAGYGAPVV